MKLQELNFKDINDKHDKNNSQSDRNIESCVCMQYSSIDYILFLNGNIVIICQLYSFYELIGDLYTYFIEIIMVIIGLDHQWTQTIGHVEYISWLVHVSLFKKHRQVSVFSITATM